jgi:myo-inositol catabolism protein IolH
MIEITADLECPLMNSEFNGRPERAAESETAFWRSLEELLPVLEREGIALNLEAHPDDFCEENTPAVDLVRAIDKPWVNYLYCAPHTFHLSGADPGADIAAMMRYAGDKLRHVHIAGSSDHKGSSGLRYILNPPGTPARIHQHLDIGQGEVDRDAFFGTLSELGFDGVATACVFAWEERARESSAFMPVRIRKEPAGEEGCPGPAERQELVRITSSCVARVIAT